MRVKFTQSGGFAGLIRQCTLDTSTMDKDDVKELEVLVQKADVSTSREVRSTSGRDLEEYEISVDDDRRSVTLVYDQSTLAPDIKPLVAYLKKCAKPGKL